MMLLQLNWSTYFIGIVIFFAGCAFLNYVVKKLNERRIETRYEAMQEKAQPIANNNEDGRVSKTPNEVKDAAIISPGISLVFNNDKNNLEHRNLTEPVTKPLTTANVITKKVSTLSADILQRIEEAASAENIENHKTPSKASFLATNQVNNKASKTVILNDKVQTSEFIKEADTNKTVDETPIKPVPSIHMKSPATMSSKNSQNTENISSLALSDASIFEPNTEEMFLKAIKNSQKVNEEIEEILLQNTEDILQMKSNETLFPFLVNTVENTEPNISKDGAMSILKDLHTTTSRNLLIDIPGIKNDEDLIKKQNENRILIEKNIKNENNDLNQLSSTLLANKPSGVLADSETQRDLIETIDDIIKKPTTK